MPVQVKLFYTKSINYEINTLEEKIDAYINEVKQTNYCIFDADKIQTIIKELQLAKDLPLEKMQVAFDRLKKETDADKVKIGSKYEGGTVFYLDKTDKHGLVCADKDFGKALWGGFGEISSNGKGLNSGLDNTQKIALRARLQKVIIKKGFFSNTYETKRK